MLSSADIQQKFFQIAEAVHFRIFGHEMGDEMRKFLGNLSWSFFGGMIAAGLFFAVSISAGRILGPEEYGKYNFIVAFASSALLIMTLGLDVTTLHFVARNKKGGGAKHYLSTSFYTVCAISGIAVFLAFLLKSIFIEDNSSQEDIFYLALFFTIVLAFKNLSDSYLRGLSLFKKQSQYKILEALIATCIFSAIYLGIFFNIALSYKSFIFLLLFSAAIIVLLIFLQVKTYIDLEYFSWNVLKEMTHYGVFILLGGISSALLLSLDKLLITQYLGSRELGLYSAYYIASMTFTTYMAVIFINVFFPKMSEKQVDKMSTLKKINKIALYALLPLFIAMSLITRGALFFFGSDYPVDWVLVAEFSLMSLLFAYFSIVWWLIAASGLRGIRFTSLAGLGIGIIFVLNMILFQSLLSIPFVVLLLSLSTGIGAILGNYVLLKKLIE